MGGHSAWRKRLAAGELAKQSGGAICRHRPHLGRKGKDREVERKGNINGGPRKKKRNKAKIDANKNERRNGRRPSTSSASLASGPNTKAGGTFVTLALRALAVVLFIGFLISSLLSGRSTSSSSISNTT